MIGVLSKGMKKNLVVLLLVVFLFSCKNSSSSDVLNIAISSEPPMLDVMMSTSLISRLVSVGNIYEKLVVLDGDGEIRCELAKDYTFSDDMKSLEFVIREGVKFHDGSMLDADDVVQSLNRWIELYAAARNFVGENRFFVTDDGNARIESDTSLALFPYLLASAPQSAVIMPSEIVSSIQKGETVNKYIGTGPYYLDSWTSGEKLVLKRFESYVSYSEESNGIWGRKDANIPVLEYYVVPDSTTRRLGLQSGQYDFINDLMSDDRSAFADTSKFQIIQGGESGSIALVFNKKEGIGTDLNLRKAISLALDPDTLLRACYGDFGYSVHSDYMEKEQYTWLASNNNPYEGQNIELAKEYLESVDVKGPVRILTSNLSNLDKIALAMESDLRNVGLDVEIISVDWASMIERRKDSSAWDIYISAFSRVPIPQLKSYLSPSFPGWIDSAEEALSVMDKMNDALSVEEAAALWIDAQKMLYESVPAIIPGHYITAYAAKSNLRGIINQDGFFFWNSTLE